MTSLKDKYKLKRIGKNEVEYYLDDVKKVGINH